MPSRTITLVQADDDRTYSVEVTGAAAGDADSYEVRVGPRLYTVAHEAEGSLRITSDETARTTTAWTVMVGDTRWVFVDGRRFELAAARPVARVRSGHPGSLMAPMPATVRRVLVTVGDPVAPGDSLVILEAMKMELPVRAHTRGVVRAVNCREGELVQPGVALIEIGDAQ